MTRKSAPGAPRIRVENLTMAYGDFILMKDLNFIVNKADVFIIMGGSGCGKSTLLRHLIGLKAPAKGRILYGDQSFWDATAEERERMMTKAGILYQSGALWSSMTLSQNVALPLEQYTQLSPAEIRDLVSF
ncbi:MAG: ATP-binding cassette domain-containing protein, partial [Desulfotignum sp.]